MSKSPIKYISLKKIIKRHYTKQKKCSFHFASKTQCVVKVEGKFHNVNINLSKNYPNIIDIMATKEKTKGNGWQDDTLFKEDITTLDRLFSLLANGCRKLELEMGAKEI